MEAYVFVRTGWSGYWVRSSRMVASVRYLLRQLLLAGGVHDTLEYAMLIAIA